MGLIFWRDCGEGSLHILRILKPWVGKSLLKFGNFRQTLTRLKNGLSIADFSIRQV